MNRFLVATTFLFQYFMAQSQDRTIDSLQALASQERNDSARVAILCNLAQNQNGYDNETGNKTLAEAFRLAQKGPYTFPMGYCYQTLADFESLKGNYQRSIQLYDSAILLYRKAALNPSQKDEARFWEIYAMASIGSSMGSMEKNTEAIEANLNAINLWKQTSHPLRFEMMGNAYSSIGSFYVNLGDFTKALEFDKKSLEAYLESGEKERISYAAIYLGQDYASFNQSDSALHYFKMAEPLVLALNKPNLNIEYYSKLGMHYLYTRQFDKGIDAMRTAIRYSYQLNIPIQIVSNEKALASLYLSKGVLDSAENVGWRALQHARDYKLTNLEMRLYKILADVEYTYKKPDKAYAYFFHYNRLKDSLSILETRKEMEKAEIRYGTLEKENRIKQLEQERKIQELSANRKKNLYISSIAGASALVLILLLSARNRRQKQKLQERRIVELETEKKLAATEAVMKGEEQERARLAKDLHDGLSGMLSGIKYTLQDMKGNLIMTPQNQQAFERSIDMLDSSIREMRRVAHNMMPEVLVRYGLDAALKDYAAEINKTGMVKLVYQSMGTEAINKMEQSQALSIYRIVQELINNVIKHASATEALVQLLLENDKLVVNVEDNGRGFDPALTQGSGGLGWSNIRSRVELMKGHLDIDTAPGKGTSVSIDFNLF